MDISNYIANLSMNMSSAKLQSDISTSVLKKAMQVGEVNAENLLETIDQSTVPNFEGSIDMHI